MKYNVGVEYLFYTEFRDELDSKRQVFTSFIFDSLPITEKDVLNKIYYFDIEKQIAFLYYFKIVYIKEEKEV